jgi:hypothetical protein
VMSSPASLVSAAVMFGIFFLSVSCDWGFCYLLDELLPLFGCVEVH